MDDYQTECIKRCEETNGPCWECPQRGWCKLWEEDDE